jgi:hypothetical protein
MSSEPVAKPPEVNAAVPDPGRAYREFRTGTPEPLSGPWDGVFSDPDFRLLGEADGPGVDEEESP